MFTPLRPEKEPEMRPILFFQMLESIREKAIARKYKNIGHSFGRTKRCDSAKKDTDLMLCVRKDDLENYF